MAPPLLIPNTPAAASWRIPERYELTRIIGTGSYGSVCQGTDKVTQQSIAVKRLKDIFDDLVDCKRLLREIAILRRLRHRNIVQIYTVHCPDPIETFSEFYIIMECCETDLKKLVKTNVELSIEMVNTLCVNLLTGLQYLHSADVYHRDLKPANCFCNQDCTVKIGDFGLARAMGAQAMQPEMPNTDDEDEAMDGRPSDAPIVPATLKLQRHLTSHVVTRWYRAPEVILLQKNYTDKIDVWSAGCIYGELLQMLPGKSFSDRSPLFPGSTCFPLSPDRKHKQDYKFHTSGKKEQLNTVFDLIGTPSSVEVDQLEKEDAKRYIQSFDPRVGDGFASVFTDMNVDPAVIELLEKMLRFSPLARISVGDALESSLFESVRSREYETTLGSGPICLEFDNSESITEDELRNLYSEEFRGILQSDLGMPNVMGATAGYPSEPGASSAMQD